MLLPNELYGEILKYVIPNDQIMVSNVCKLWDNILHGIFNNDDNLTLQNNPYVLKIYINNFGIDYVLENLDIMDITNVCGIK